MAVPSSGESSAVEEKAGEEEARERDEVHEKSISISVSKSKYGHGGMVVGSLDTQLEKEKEGKASSLPGQPTLVPDSDRTRASLSPLAGYGLGGRANGISQSTRKWRGKSGSRTGRRVSTHLTLYLPVSSAWPLSLASFMEKGAKRKKGGGRGNSARGKRQENVVRPAIGAHMGLAYGNSDYSQTGYGDSVVERSAGSAFRGVRMGMGDRGFLASTMATPYSQSKPLPAPSRTRTTSINNHSGQGQSEFKSRYMREADALGQGGSHSPQSALPSSLGKGVVRSLPHHRVRSTSFQPRRMHQTAVNIMPRHDARSSSLGSESVLEVDEEEEEEEEDEDEDEEEVEEEEEEVEKEQEQMLQRNRMRGDGHEEALQTPGATREDMFTLSNQRFVLEIYCLTLPPLEGLPDLSFGHEISEEIDQEAVMYSNNYRKYGDGDTEEEMMESRGRSGEFVGQRRGRETVGVPDGEELSADDSSSDSTSTLASLVFPEQPNMVTKPFVEELEETEKAKLPVQTRTAMKFLKKRVRTLIADEILDFLRTPAFLPLTQPVVGACALPMSLCPYPYPLSLSLSLSY